jgi:hypothetical protein
MVTSPFPEVGQGYSKMATVFADSAAQIQSLQRTVGETQQGKAAEAAMTRLQGHQRVLEAMHERCTTVVTVSAIQADADAALLQAPGPADVEQAEQRMKAARMAGNIGLYKARMEEAQALSDERHAALESHKAASEQSDATLKSLTDITLPRDHSGTPPSMGMDDGGIEQGDDEDRDRQGSGLDGNKLPRDTVMPREHQGVEPSRDTVMPRVHDGTPPPDTSTHLSSSAAPPITSPQTLGGMASQPAMGSGAPGGGGMSLPQAVAGMGNGAQGGKSGERGSRRRRDEDDDTKKWRDGLERLLAEPAPISVAPVAPAMPSPSSASAGMSPTTHLSGGSIPTAPAPAAPATGTPPMGGGGGGVPLGGGAAQHARNAVKPPNITEVMPPEPLPGTAYADAPDGKSDERKSA